jgi:hypothetical protein
MNLAARRLKISRDGAKAARVIPGGERRMAADPDFNGYAE